MTDRETRSADLLTPTDGGQAPWQALAERYELLAEVGAGGMGIVYKARDRETGAIVALKILKPELASDPTISGRFKNELLLARKITHKNVCRIYEFARAGTTAYISMEYVEGESLRAVLKRRGRLPADEAIRIARQICGALAEAHGAGVVHRDLKPENVMIDQTGAVKLMDFGIARSIETDTSVTVGLIGTPSYMAPEQAAGKSVDARTDLYAVGLILYEMLTGQPTFTGDTLMAVALKHLNEAPRSPRELESSIPAALERTVLRCLEKDPERRFSSATELESVLAADAGPVAASARARVPALLRRRRTLGAALLTAVVMLAVVLFSRRPARLEVPFREYTLANGLRVILAEDHTAPTVSVAMTYRVGSRDEKPGRTGFAHLFEHMMFQGSQNVGKGEHIILVQNNGGSVNGTTNWDRTSYYQTLPANQLELALFLEADRLRGLDLSEANFENQRQAVLEERRLQIDNQAYGRTEVLLGELAYASFAYQHHPIGNAEDLRAATLADAREFFQTHYVPANAVLSIVGDFAIDAALARVRTYFESIAARTPPPASEPNEPPQTEERRRAIEDPFARATRIDMAYKAPRAYTQDWYALRLLAVMLGQGNSSRLNRRLVREGEVAASVGSGIDVRGGPSLFRILTILRPGKQPDQAEQLIADEIQRIVDGPVDPEDVRKARLQWRRGLSQQFQSTLQRATALGDAAAVHGNADVVNQLERSHERVTPADIQRVARQYLTPRNRTIVVTTPGSGRPAAAGAAPPADAESRAVPLSSVVRKGLAPISSDILTLAAPRPVRITLANGLTALVIEDRRAPVVYVNVSVSGAGPLYDPRELPGLAAVTAQMLDEGTASRTSREIAEQIERLGAAVVTGADAGSSSTTTRAWGLSENVEEWLPLLADVLQNPRFSSDELNALRQRLLVQLRQQRASPYSVAYDRLARSVFGAHPAAMTAPEPATLERVTPDMLKRWHAERFAPQQTIIGIVGDVDARQVRRLLERWFGAWGETNATEELPPPPAPPLSARIMLVDRPGSVQANILVGGLGIDRRSEDYIPLRVMNAILGEGASARLFLNLREQKGYTYGIGSTFSALKYPGLWWVSTAVRTEVAAPALREILSEIRRIVNEPVPSAELEAAKRSTVARFALSLEQPQQILSNWTIQTIYGFSEDYWDTYPAKVMAVNVGEVQQVARRYLEDRPLQLVIVGDAAKLRASLAEFGRVEVFPSSSEAATAMRVGR